MHIRIVVLIKIPKCLDDGARFLRSRGAIEVDQRMTVRLLAQNREIFTDRLPIESAGGNLVHTIICYTRRRTPLYSLRGIARFLFISSLISAEVRTGTIWKSIRSRQLAIH